MKVIFDLEWTTKESFREIIQIGYILCDDQFSKMHKKKLYYIYPIINQKISSHVVNLTGIKDSDLKKKGISYSSALNFFLNDAKEANFIYSFGYDFNIIKENNMKKGIELSSLYKDKFKNIRFKICKYLNIGYHSINSANLIDYCSTNNLNKNKQLFAHNALDDSQSIFYFLKTYNKLINV